MHFAGFGGWFLAYQPVNPETPPPKQPFLIFNCGPEIKGLKFAPLHRKWLLRAAIVYDDVGVEAVHPVGCTRLGAAPLFWGAVWGGCPRDAGRRVGTEAVAQA